MKVVRAGRTFKLIVTRSDKRGTKSLARSRDNRLGFVFKPRDLVPLRSVSRIRLSDRVLSGTGRCGADLPAATPVFSARPTGGSPGARSPQLGGGGHLLRPLAVFSARPTGGSPGARGQLSVLLSVCQYSLVAVR